MKYDMKYVKRVRDQIDPDLVLGITEEAMVSLDLLCGICEHIPEDPAKTRTSNQIYCRGCLDGYGSDPIDGSDMTTEDYLDVETIRLNQIMNLRLVCENKGCDWTGPLSVFNLHVANCDLGEVVCEFCNFRPKRKDLDVHIDEDHSPSSIVRYFEDKMRKMDEKFDRIKEELVEKFRESERDKEELTTELTTKSLEFDRIKEKLVAKSLEFDRIKEELATKIRESERDKEKLATKSREFNIRSAELIITRHLKIRTIRDHKMVDYKCIMNPCGNIDFVSLSNAGEVNSNTDNIIDHKKLNRRCVRIGTFFDDYSRYVFSFDKGLQLLDNKLTYHYI
jgi:hypothetical protein